MTHFNLIYRQRKLLHILQSLDGVATGVELAKKLNVSPRTIRSDIKAINTCIKPYRAEIRSKKACGYRFYAEDPALIASLNKMRNAFLTRNDRVRYLAFCLCLQETPLNINDLADEMFVSCTTIKSDIEQLKKEYTFSYPFIALNLYREHIYFENDENKKRKLLNDLFHKDWNYDSHGTTYYEARFLDEDLLNYFRATVPAILNEHGVNLEDPNFIFLILSLTIMYQRIQTGHILTDVEYKVVKNARIKQAVKILFFKLEEHFQMEIPSCEKQAIYNYLSSWHYYSVDHLNSDNIIDHFYAETIHLTYAYIEQLRVTYMINLALDQDLFFTLLFFIQNIVEDTTFYFDRDHKNLELEALMTEFELAEIIQPIVYNAKGRYLSFTELLQLARIINGGLKYLYVSHPEKKIRIALSGHLNTPSLWNLKRQVLELFSNYVNITVLLPIYMLEFYDLSKTDLLLTTAHKGLMDSNCANAIKINSTLSGEDKSHIFHYISSHIAKTLCLSPRYTVRELLDNALWHEDLDYTTLNKCLDKLFAEMKETKIIDRRHIDDLMRKEKEYPPAATSGIYFIHSAIPCRETKLSIAIFSAAVTVHGFHVHAIIVGAFEERDLSLVIPLNCAFYRSAKGKSITAFPATKKEFIDLFSR